MKENDKQLAREHEESRLKDPRMAYYNEVFKNSKRWTGEESLEGKKVIVYCEQGVGDIIHMARYWFHLSRIMQATIDDRRFNLMAYCPKSLHKLFPEWACLDKENPELPEHDFHVLSLSLPFLVGERAGEMNGPGHTVFPYIRAEAADLSEASGPDDFRIGICWEGSPLHDNNEARCCPLKHFKPLVNSNWSNDTKLFCLQKYIHDQKLIEDCEDLELYGVELNDFKDTAKLIRSMNVVVTVDTAVAHLAGAMNKKIHLLLSDDNDGRWGDKGDTTRWYKSMKVWRVPRLTTSLWQSATTKTPPAWGEVLCKVHTELSKMTD